MKKAILPIAVALAAGVSFAVVNATAKDKPKKIGHGNTIHVIEHATTDSIDVDARGHVLTFANDVFDSADANKVGTDQGYCIRIIAPMWECDWTTFLPGGQITVEGPFSDTANTVLAITGGTGKYRNARGQMELNSHTSQNPEYDFVFHLHGGPGH